MKRILTFFIFMLLAMGPGAAGAQTVVRTRGTSPLITRIAGWSFRPSSAACTRRCWRTPGLDADELAPGA